MKYEFVSYPNVVHSFTVPEADSHKIEGMKYDKAADRRSWAATVDFLKEVLS